LNTQHQQVAVVLVVEVVERGSLPHLRKRDRVRVGALDTLSV